MFGSFLGKLFGADVPTAAYKTTDLYSDIRSKILALKSEKPTDTDATRAIAVLIELGLPQAVVTLVSYDDGGASMYFSSGGGIIGAGELPHPEARAASLKLTAAAPSFVSLMTKTEKFPLPQINHTRFYIVTPKGVYTVEVRSDDLAANNSPLFPFYLLGDKLITQIRLIDEASQKAKAPSKGS